MYMIISKSISKQINEITHFLSEHVIIIIERYAIGGTDFLFCYLV